jgi:hypothetical protein
MANRPDSVSNWMPKKPTKTNASLMEPNAKDNPDSLTPESPYKQALGGSGKPKGPFGKKGREC